MSLRAVVGVALGLAFLTAACADPAGTAASGGTSRSTSVQVSSCGQRLSFAQPPERAVALDQSATETLLALGLRDQLAGTAGLKTKVAKEYQAAYEKVPVLSGKQLTGEQLRAATPDVVVSSWAANLTKDLGRHPEGAERSRSPLVRQRCRLP